MSEQDAFERIIASLYDAMLDDTYWPDTSALIDEACGLTGNALLVGEGPPDDIRVLFVGLYYRGQRRTDLEREYLDIYGPINEAIPRLRQLPDGHLVPIQRPVHGRGVENLAYLQRGLTPGQVPEWPERAFETGRGAPA